MPYIVVYELKTALFRIKNTVVMALAFLKLIYLSLLHNSTSDCLFPNFSDCFNRKFLVTDIYVLRPFFITSAGSIFLTSGFKSVSRLNMEGRGIPDGYS